MLERINSGYHLFLTISAFFKLISQKEYINYRDTVYLSPGKAKNMLLDKLSFDGTPFCREDFNFVDLKELSPDVERALKKFIDTLKRNQD